jgi:hypothetical protein
MHDNFGLRVRASAVSEGLKGNTSPEAYTLRGILDSDLYDDELLYFVELAEEYCYRYHLVF